MRMRPSLWVPVPTTSQRAITSGVLEEMVPGEGDRVLTTGELREGDAKDEVLLFVEGELAVRFEVRRGLGAQVLRECGLETAQASDARARAVQRGK